MTGERMGQQSPSPRSGPDEPAARPPCAINFKSALIHLNTVNSGSSEEDVGYAFDWANQFFIKSIEAAKAVSGSDCSNCLEGRGVDCPIKETAVELSSTLRELRKLSTVPARRMQKVLKNGGLSGPTPIDQSLANELSGLGFNQSTAREVSAPDIDPPPREIPDPRGPEVRERATIEEFKEDRPNCASLLSLFIKERREARTRWKKRNIGKPSSEWPKFKGTGSLRIYAQAIDASEGVDLEDCNRCLDEFCPLKNDVSAAEFYDTTRIEVKLSDGSKTKLLPRIENILDGLPWNRLLGPPNPTYVTIGIVDTLRELAQRRASGTDL